MKFKYIIYTLALTVLAACKKDLGNYNYSPPSEPILVNFTDRTFDALVGDSLILQPYVELDKADLYKDLIFDWEIFVDEEARSDKYTGYPLKIVYNLSPKTRTAKLTVTDKRNQMKYFFPFKIAGNTQFTKGMTVLSVDAGVTKLSFVKPDSVSILSNLYYSLHNENLPANPVQLFAKPYAYQPGTAEDYWVIAKDGEKSSVIIDGNTMLRKRYFPEQFFSPPANIVTERFEASKGFATGIINGKLYLSVTTTAPFAPDWGKFASPQSGDYTLSPYFGNTNNFYFGFDTKTKAFVSFSSTGSYSGTEYQVSGSAFNPKSIGMSNLLFMQPVPGTTYAFFKDDAGEVYELSFSIDMDNYFSSRIIKPYTKKVFKGSALVNADTKWQRSGTDVFYFSSNDKIYRYNPLNEELRLLDANLSGKKISMLKLSGNTLTAGIDGALVFLDVSVGSNGKHIKTIEGIPGAPVDFVSKNL
ncbi:hypothetical protein LJ707_04520 [Mucilaginibacter sp. UR6-1]|uniref:PKD-like family lipoprotein n=1 Tax=Mucilaginibacter sp. UR6-1 TaxID=1435643 RepID=UPI001E454739|nr:PKD-like family lipoprotein [Mucilaginibacter sp. UR6-1]MCC8408182.1 hypothetical protein [Mucilaginibacter sp. UR6-1]